MCSVPNSARMLLPADAQPQLRPTPLRERTDHITAVKHCSIAFRCLLLCDETCRCHSVFPMKERNKHCNWILALLMEVSFSLSTILLEESSCITQAPSSCEPLTHSNSWYVHAVLLRNLYACVWCGFAFLMTGEHPQGKWGLMGQKPALFSED